MAYRCIRHVPTGPQLVPRGRFPLAEDLWSTAVEVVADSHVVIQGASEAHIIRADGRTVASFPGCSSASAIAGSTTVLLASWGELDEIDAVTGAPTRRVYTLPEESIDDLVAVRSLSAREAVLWTRERGLVLLDLASGEVLRSHPRADPNIDQSGTLLAHPDGRRVLAFMTDTTDDILVWDTQDGRSSRLDGSDRVSAVAIAPDGRHVAIATAHALVVVDLETGETVFERAALGPTALILWLPGPAEHPTPVLAVAASNHLHLLDVLGDELLSATALPEPARALAAAPGGLLFVAGQTTLGAWQLSTGPRSFPAYTSVLTEPSLGEALVSGYSIRPQRWDLATGRFRGPYTIAAEDHLLRGEFIALALPTIFVHRNESIELLDTSTCSIRGGIHDHGLDGGPLPVRHVSDSRARFLYAIPPHGALHVAELRSRAAVSVNAGVDLTLADAAFLDRDGATIVSGHLDGAVRIWDVATGTTTRTIATLGPVSRVLAARGSIYTGHADGRVSVWDATTGATLHVWPAHPTAVLALAFDADAGILATASAASVRVWQFTGDHIPALVGEEPTTSPPVGLTTTSGSVLFLEDRRLVILAAVPSA